MSTYINVINFYLKGPIILGFYSIFHQLRVSQSCFNIEWIITPTTTILSSLCPRLVQKDLFLPLKMGWPLRKWAGSNKLLLTIKTLFQSLIIIYSSFLNYTSKLYFKRKSNVFKILVSEFKIN